MIDPISLALTALAAASQYLTTNPRTPYETFSDPATATVGVSAIAATYDPVTQCVVTYDPATNQVLSVTLPDPSVPEYDYCLAHMNGETFNG